MTAQNNKLIADLNSKLKSGAIQQADAKKQLAKVDADIAAGQKILQGMKEQYSQIRTAARTDNFGAKGKSLDREIAALNKKIAAYEGALNAQIKQRSAIQVS